MTERRRSRRLSSILRPSREEDGLHLAVANLLEWILIPPAMFTTFPAGYGKLSVVTASNLKKRGMKAGFPDILIFDVAIGHTDQHVYSKVVGIELKARGRYPSSEQRNVHAKLQACGVRTYVCRSVDEVIEALKAEGIHFRASSYKERNHVKDSGSQPSLFEFSPYR